MNKQSPISEQGCDLEIVWCTGKVYEGTDSSRHTSFHASPDDGSD